jgi:hypothetical protein
MSAFGAPLSQSLNDFSPVMRSGMSRGPIHLAKSCICASVSDADGRGWPKWK